MIHLIGYIALGINLLSMTMKNVLLLRLLSLVANVIYLIYGILLQAPPFIIGCGIAIVIHGFHIFKLTKSRKSTHMKGLPYIIPLLLLFSCQAPLAEKVEPDATSQKIDQLFTDFNTLKSPGYAVGVIQDTSILYAKGFGAANLDYGIAIDQHTAFDIASVSKQFTAACIALLILDGEISLDDPAQLYVPELAKYPATIRLKHLVYNTSGITDYFKLPRSGPKPWLDFYYFDIDEAISTSLAQDSLAFIPGTKWDYSNVNFMLLAKVVEEVSGQSFSAFIQARLFDPLEMKNTLVHDDITAIIPNRVTPYNRRDSATVEAYRAAGIEVKHAGKWIHHHRNSPHYGGSGIISTLADLIRWEQNFFTREFGGDAFYDLMHQTPKFDHERDNQAFGLYFGNHQDRPFVAWDGGTSGISAQIMRFPEQQVAIVVLSNLGTGNASGKAIQIADVLIAEGVL